MRAKIGLFALPAIFLLVLVPCAVFAQNPAQGYIGIWADQYHSGCDVFPAQYALFDAWIWCLPSDNGLQAAEYAVSLPSKVIILSVVQNPDIAVSLGTLTAGISVAFGEGYCQTDWVWTHHVTCMSLTQADPGIIEIIPHPGVLPQPAYQFANCTLGFPIEPCAVLSNLYVNQWCGPPPAPVLTGVEVLNPLSLRAMASQFCLDMSYTGRSFASFFSLRSVADPADSIRMTWAEVGGASGTEIFLALERQMVEGTTYSLEATLCNYYYMCAESAWQFLYSGGFEPQPNLLFTYVSDQVWAPECAGAMLEFTITNNGSAPAGPFEVEIEADWPLDKEMVFTRLYGGLDPGESLSDSLIAPLHTFESVENREYWARIDVPGEVYEWVENDNIRNLIVCNYYPYISSILDVPGDTGGAVRIAFDLAGYHHRNYTLPNEYLIMRRIGHTDGWDQVATVPGAPIATSYTVDAPTAVDSTGGTSDYWSVYKVMLRTILNTVPPDTVYHASCPDSGYSVDDLGPTATLLQSSSAAFSGSGVELSWKLSEIDAGVEFLVSRSKSGGDFVPLDVTGLSRTGLAFSYVDTNVEPGEGYVYKVEYSLEGRSRLLFISQEVRTPAASLALDQNRPNPFNPSTTISFSLPEACEVRLEVYDVSGRLVARLVDGRKLGAGAHEADWNGRDVSGGTAASGVYIYRLIAGKETISKKMVLLR